MMGGPGRFGNFLNQETLKPKSISETLRPAGAVLRSLLLPCCCWQRSSSITATWAQVTTPEMTGQATDCFLVPAGASAFGRLPGRRTTGAELRLGMLAGKRSIHAERDELDHCEALFAGRV